MSTVYGNVVSAGDQSQNLFSEHFGTDNDECDVSMAGSYGNHTANTNISHSVNQYSSHDVVANHLSYVIIPYGNFKGQYDMRNSQCMNSRLHYSDPEFNSCKYCKHIPYVPSPLRHSITAKDIFKQPLRKHERSSRPRQNAKEISKELNDLIDVLIELKDSGIFSGETTNPAPQDDCSSTRYQTANKENEDINMTIQNPTHSKHGFFRNPNISKMCNSVSNKFKSISSTNF